MFMYLQRTLEDSMGRILIALIALLPSLWYLAQARGIPHLGHFGDDGLYAGTAAAIAEGKGPRVESLPGEPWQVKYPPLFPLYLSPGANREWLLTLLTWLPLPGLLALASIWRPHPLLPILIGWNAYSVLFAGSAMTELFATVWQLLAIILLERSRPLLASAAASAAYLARTANLALAAGCIGWLLWRRRWRDAALFAAIFLPVAAGWWVFTATHTPADISGTMAFYLSYSKFYAENVTPELFPVMLWTNLQMLVAGAGGLLFFNGGGSFWEVNFARLLLFASISGLVRDARKHGVSPYVFMSIPFAILLCIWNFVPHERFLYPMLPLLLHGFLTEMSFLRGMLQASARRQPMAALLIGSLAVSGLCWAAYRNAIAAWMFAPSVPARYRNVLTARADAHAWIRANTPAHANFLAYEDTALRRGAGRHGSGFHFPTRYFYENNHQAILEYHRDIIGRMRGEQLDYLLIGPNDMEVDIRPEDRQRIVVHWRSLPELEKVYENKLYAVFRLRGTK
jgi:hypothetical protein